MTFKYPCASTKDCFPYEVTFPSGYYQIECFGAGYPLGYKIYGAYTKGSIHFNQSTTLYFYLGASKGHFNVFDPNDSPIDTIFSNGATDIRTEKGDYFSFNSLKSRIMVAAGAATTDDLDGQFGHGGALEGITGIGNYSRTGHRPHPLLIVPGATQLNGGVSSNSKCYSGRFGLISFKKMTLDYGGFGGGGYYAGTSIDGYGNGGGGSSFISGYKGCDAIDANSTDFDKIFHTGQSIHYSGYQFFDSQMKPGNETFYKESGKVIVTILVTKETCKKNINLCITPLFYFIIISS